MDATNLKPDALGNQRQGYSRSFPVDSRTERRSRGGHRRLRAKTPRIQALKKNVFHVELPFAKFPLVNHWFDYPENELILDFRVQHQLDLAKRRPSKLSPETIRLFRAFLDRKISVAQLNNAMETIARKTALRAPKREDPL